MNLTYQWLHDTVRARFDSNAAMEAFLPQALPPEELRRKSDDRYLSAMTQRVFQAGIQHSVVDAKWPAFEAAFSGFDPTTMVALSDADIEQHMQNTTLIRHRAKMQTIAQNARFILDVRQEQSGSFGAFIADWPVTDIIGLWRLLATRGARLGGRSAAGFLRLVGKDTFLLTSDVVARLVAAGVVTREPSAQRDLQAVQEAFNALHAASGRPLCQLSALCALSIHPAF
ncbi:DNA-3-methyladenine glycosylase I [Castellaniella sp. S9]|uniref:DNA-3-methyladenine glycosylase I n=1 Tax=Castellaniella sp. S9 TaxID=2993652 RepID=UPI0022B3B7B0|nr:DNA-3-methyladenine glycosylase I [Castellaniella sp. S9]